MESINWMYKTNTCQSLLLIPKYNIPDILNICTVLVIYDQSRDDYLVVVLSYENVSSPHLEFFSIRDNRWKEIEGTHFAYYGPHVEGLLFNGAIHWLASRYDDIFVIVAFDLIERKLFEIPLSDDFEEHALYTSPSLWAFGEFLSLWLTNHDNATVEIWVMKEYKLNSSWTKTLVLPLHVNPHVINLDFYVNIICSTNNCDIICSTKNGGNIGATSCASTCSRLVKYNNKGQLLEFPFFLNDPSDVGLYTESLLSLPGNTEQD